MKVESGNRFSRLVVQSPLGLQNSHQMWKCVCDCGRECVAREDKLLGGRTKSCGCLQAEMSLSANEQKELRDDVRTTLRELKKSLVLSQRLNSQLLHRQLVRIGIPVDDYRSFEYTGSPRQAAELLRDWAGLVHEVLSHGPGDDVVTIKVTISVDQPPKP